MVFCGAVLQLRLLDMVGGVGGASGAVLGDGPVAVLGGGVDNARAEGDLASLDIFLITLLLLYSSELGHVGGETLTLGPSAKYLSV